MGDESHLRESPGAQPPASGLKAPGGGTNLWGELFKADVIHVNWEASPHGSRLEFAKR